MPSTDELVTMVAHRFQMSRSKYVTTRSRQDFTDDATALLRQNIMPVALITNIVSQMFGGDDSQPEKLQAPKQERPPASREDVEKMRRERNSGQMYPWLRRVGGRNYKVFNLDTRDAGQFKEAVGAMSKSLAVRTK